MEDATEVVSVLSVPKPESVECAVGVAVEVAQTVLRAGLAIGVGRTSLEGRERSGWPWREEGRPGPGRRGWQGTWSGQGGLRPRGERGLLPDAFCVV